MEFKDYYKILGVERTADKKAISQAFRKLARQHHHDVNRGSKDAEARFKEINEAYQVLNDPERRGKYDQLLELRQHGGGWEEALRRGAAPGGDGTFTVFSEGVGPEGLGQFSDFFQQVFGSAFRPGGRRRGRGAEPDVEDLLRQQARSSRAGRRAAAADVEGTVEITLEEAYTGTVRTVTIPAERGTPRSIEVKVPRGVRGGQRIRAAGQANGADLYLVVQILPHPRFTRDQDDLMCEVAVPVWTAALGGEIEVPTLGGQVTMTVPPGTRDGRTFRLRGQGMPHVRGGGAGDLLAKVRLTLPDRLTPRDRELFEEMRRLHETPAAKS
jgi:curved DNA-binding protein